MKVKQYFLKLRSVAFWQNSVMKWSVVSIVGIVVVQWGLILSTYQSGGFVPWHYTVYFGIDRVGSWYSLLLYPCIGTVVALSNTIGIILLYYRRRLFAQVLLLMTIAIQVVLLIQISGLLWFIL